MQLKKQTRKSRRAVSPVIATVILVAITITVAVAVAYWMSGIAGQYTAFEKVEIQSANAVKTAEGWTIELTLKNTGTATATLIDVFISDVPVVGTTTFPDPHTMDDLLDCETAVGTEWAGTGTNILDPALIKDTIESGAEQTIEVYIGIDYASLSSGTTVNVKIHSAGGMDYIRLVQLS